MRYKIEINGKVQGVGFRPFIYQIATSNSISGEVYNSGTGVVIYAKCDSYQLDKLLKLIKTRSPELAQIKAIKVSEIARTKSRYNSFSISHSKQGRIKTLVPADAGICADCIADISDKNRRWYNYAFTNCTNCGPRFSIIKAIPYDRKATSMAEFTMCENCQAEYENPLDRRFHAQPCACPECGPELSLLDKKKNKITCKNPIYKTVELLLKGEIVAIKGIGGFHLACLAIDEKAVRKLRKRKHRPHKPLALMAKDIEMVKNYCEVSDYEQNLLTSFKTPIVLLKQTGKLAGSIAPGQTRLGFMLPYSPLHYLLTAKLDAPIVLTSGNQVDEPQIVDNSLALEHLNKIADYFLLHNRDIVNRVDDSVVQVVAGKQQILRRARGYAPTSFSLPAGFEAAPEILAVGAELKNTFCLIGNEQTIVSQHIGDLKNIEAYQDFQNNIKLYKKLYSLSPKILACDMHPEYLSTKFVEQYAEKSGVDLVRVQHHHAHLAAGLFEQKKPLDCNKVLGAIWDGVGYGPDNTSWGGEFLLADYTEFSRLAHFDNIPLLGGDKAAKEPWRLAYAYLQHYNIKGFKNMFATKPIKSMTAILDSEVRLPTTTAVGRLFDAVAYVLGIAKDGISYESQAAIELENLSSDSSANSSYEFDIKNINDSLVISSKPMWLSIMADLTSKIPKEEVSYKFHLSLARLIVDVCLRLQKYYDFDEIVLSGGVFQNKLLTSLTLDLLGKDKVFIPEKLPPGDGGISLGQAAVCAARSIKAKTKF